MKVQVWIDGTMWLVEESQIESMIKAYSGAYKIIVDKANNFVSITSRRFL